jgi:hypothetical protein
VGADQAEPLVVLIVQGGISELRFLPGKNGNAVDRTGSGVVPELRLGEHSKKVRAGKEEVKATSA